MTENDLIQSILREQEDDELVAAARVYADWLIEQGNPEGEALSWMLDSKFHERGTWPPVFNQPPTVYVEDGPNDSVFLAINGWTDAFNQKIGIADQSWEDGAVMSSIIKIGTRIKIKRWTDAARDNSDRRFCIFEFTLVR